MIWIILELCANFATTGMMRNIGLKAERVRALLTDFKTKRIVNQKLLATVRRQKCCACGKWPPNEAHHVTTIGSRLGNDTEQNVMPLCGKHHKEWHDTCPSYMYNRYPSLRNWLKKMERHDILNKKLHKFLE
jgi:hypothetical protein